MKFTKWLKDTYAPLGFGSIEMLELRPSIMCKDGFHMSVQASKMHYCTPRENLPNGNYMAVEIGFPSAREELIMAYAEDPSTPTETVYPYVPVGIVEKVIEKHGGFKINTKLTKTKIEEMAKEIQSLCIKHDWNDTIIYFNNKRIFANYYKHTNDEVEEDINPHDYFEWAAYDHILSMSFEGGLYEYIDSNLDAPLLNKIFKKYGVYFELGNAWNLTVYLSDDDTEVEYTKYERPKETEWIFRHKTYDDPRIQTLILIYEKAIQGKSPCGSCIIGDGINFKLDGNPYKFDTNYQQSDAPSEVIDLCKHYLELVGATDIWYDCGRLD